MTLSELKRGEVALIHCIANDLVRAQAIRFGISEGSEIMVEEVLPAGPVIVQRGNMHYAVGRNLAKEITVVYPERGIKHA
ncbi:MAG TPA: FeoA family protein [Bacillota bacterium]|nr:FeoA family protein [Bacillota bacterium]